MYTYVLSDAIRELHISQKKINSKIKMKHFIAPLHQFNNYFLELPYYIFLIKQAKGETLPIKSDRIIILFKLQ